MSDVADGIEVDGVRLAVRARVAGFLRWYPVTARDGYRRPVPGGR
jgi:hypothetical protein